MAPQTGSTYISGTMIDSVEVSTANMGFSIVTSSKKVPSDDYDDDRQPEIAIWLQIGSTYISGNTVNIL